MSLSTVTVNCPLSCIPSCFVGGGKKHFPWYSSSSTAAKPRTKRVPHGVSRVSAFLFDPSREPVLREALKEPVAFMGGVFAGLLRLDLNEDPLKEWITRTVEASGITEEEFTVGDVQPSEGPQQIEIE